MCLLLVGPSEYLLIQLLSIINHLKGYSLEYAKDLYNDYFIPPCKVGQEDFFPTLLMKVRPSALVRGLFVYCNNHTVVKK